MPLIHLTCSLIFLSTLLIQSQAPTMEESKELLREAGKLMPEAYHDFHKSKHVIALLDKAIEMDSHNPNPYLAKAGFYIRLEMRPAAIRVLARLLSDNPEVVGALTYQGFILERMGRRKDAKEKYLQDITKCNKLIEETKQDSVLIMQKLARAVAISFAFGTTHGKREYDKILAAFPQNQTIQFERSMFYEFNRKTFLKEW